ncbi:MAG: hypothetical protein ACWGNB_03485 [Thiogranum sp.]
MADLFSVTAPLAIRFRDTGEKQIMVERIPYHDGLVFLPAFWTETGIETALRYVAGPIEGDGPWKVGNAIVSVLACHGTDAALAGEFSAWQTRVLEIGDAFPDKSEIETRMKTCAATAAGLEPGDPRFRPDHSTPSR